MFAAIGKLDARTCNEVGDGTGYQNFVRRGEGTDAGTDVHADAGYVVAPHLHLAGVQTGPDLEVQCLRGPAEFGRAPDGASGSIEEREVAIASVLDQPAAILIKSLLNDVIQVIEDGAPLSISERTGAFGRYPSDGWVFTALECGPVHHHNVRSRHDVGATDVASQKRARRWPTRSR